MQQLPTTKQIKNYLYNPQHKLGKGSSSTVYRGQHITTNETVAIKVIDVKSNKTDLQRILIGNEIRALKLMNHENVMKTHEVYQTTNNIYIVSEYCELGDLSGLIKMKGGKMGEEEALNIVIQILLGVIHIHAKGILHRDLKPQNVLIKNGVKEHVYKIIDFGFCDINSDNNKLQQSYNVGSPPYMSPEAYRKCRYSTRSDLWAVGIVLLEMLLGDLPFKGCQYDVIVQQVESGEALRGLTCGQMLKGIISRMLSVEVEKRIEPTEAYNLLTAYRSEITKNIKPVNQNKLNQQNKSPPQPPIIDTNKPTIHNPRREFMESQKHLRGSLMMNHSPTPKPNKPRDISPTRPLDRTLLPTNPNTSPTLSLSIQLKTIANKKLKIATDFMSLLSTLDQIKTSFPSSQRIILLTLKMTKQYLQQTTSMFQEDNKVLTEQEQESLKNHINNFNSMQMRYNQNTLFGDLYFSFNLEYLRLEGEFLNYLQFWVKRGIEELGKLGEKREREYCGGFSKGYVCLVRMGEIIECLKKNPGKVELVSENKVIQSLIRQNNSIANWDQFQELQEKLKAFRID